MAGKQGKASAKHGRNKKKCERYKAAHTRERNKLVKLASHINRVGKDDVAKAAMLRAQRAIYAK